MIRVSPKPASVILAAFVFSMSSVHTLNAQGEKTSGKNATKAPNAIKTTEEKKLETATLGGGCFWCVEAVYQRVNGVKSVVSGYAGGSVANPTYQAVCTGETGHAEVCQITFDPSVVTFEEMLMIFFDSHDPTTLNKQGNDLGTQYRSVVFYEDETQRVAAEKIKAKLLEQKKFRKIVTEISPLPEFYAAEAYHQNYFKSHPEAGYCQYTIVPKVEKFEKHFKENSAIQKEREAKKNLKK